MDINWSLLNPVDTGAQVQQGFATGMAMVKQVQSKNALRAYLANPQDEHAFSALSYYDPETANSIQKQQMLRDEVARKNSQEDILKRIGAVAATGDYAGASKAALVAGNPELAKQLTDFSTADLKREHDKYEGTAPIAYQMSKLPYEQRKSYLQSTAPELKTLGWTDQQLQGFDPTDQNLAGIIGTGSKLSEMISADKPQYLALQPGGAVAAVGGGQPSRLVIAQNPGNQTTGAPVVTQGGGSGTAGKNNPGALKDTKGNFMSFATPEEGIAAQEARLSHRYLGAGYNTVRKVVERYAPRGPENSDASVNNYITHVSSRLGVNPDDALSQAVVPKLAAAMREFETGHFSKPAAASSGVDKVKVRADALEAIALGADPAKVKAAAAAHGVNL